MRLVEADGWKHVRTTGSYRHYKHAMANVVTILRIQAMSAGRHSEIDPESGGIGESKMSVKYAVLFEQAERNWAAYVPDLPGCMTTGKTLEETEINIREAIEGHLKTLRDFGDPVPQPTRWLRKLKYHRRLNVIRSPRLPTSPTAHSQHSTPQSPLSARSTISPTEVFCPRGFQDIGKLRRP